LRHPAPDASIRRLGKLTFIFFYFLLNKIKTKTKTKQKKYLLFTWKGIALSPRNLDHPSTKLTFARLLVFGIKNVL
jgi:hypothetical protein